MASTFYIRSPWFEEAARDIFSKKEWEEQNRPDCIKKRYAIKSNIPVCNTRDFLHPKVFLTDGQYRREVMLDQNSHGSNIKNKIEGTQIFTDKAQFADLLLKLQKNHCLPDTISINSDQNIEHALTKYRYVIIKPSSGYDGPLLRENKCFTSCANISNMSD